MEASDDVPLVMPLTLGPVSATVGLVWNPLLEGNLTTDGKLDGWEDAKPDG
jgi:hypothetical protein